jgi:putative NADH-flavin reductase
LFHVLCQVLFDALTSRDIVGDIQLISTGADAVVSCIGSIGSLNDEEVNAASGAAAAGAKAAGVARFVYVGVAPEVRASMGGIDQFKPYMAGKASSEAKITAAFGNSGICNV